MDEPWDRLRAILDRAMPALGAVSDAQAAVPHSQGKWSPKEVIGHLIDSATNNHGRFIRAQLTGSLRFEGYAQDDWVRVQQYRSAPWGELIELWRRLNLQLARVMELAPAEARSRPRNDQNLDLIAFIPPGP